MKTIAIVGATGAVGVEFGRVLAQRKFPAKSYRLLASARSAGSKLDFAGAAHAVQELTPGAFDGIDIAFFSAGGRISREYAPIAAKAGAVVIDNSSAWR
ncbi:MAG: aspartate-semialdehyde dehydrogenase, partial [Phycisphaerales bacterium]|nr:aspartate-semialdehyde dehydrogenase [Phycisphaerales bacterium]